jgi:hypothetical protein
VHHRTYATLTRGSSLSLRQENRPRVSLVSNCYVNVVAEQTFRLIDPAVEKNYAAKMEGHSTFPWRRRRL